MSIIIWSIWSSTGRPAISPTLKLFPYSCILLRKELIRNWNSCSFIITNLFLYSFIYFFISWMLSSSWVIYFWYLCMFKIFYIYSPKYLLFFLIQLAHFNLFHFLKLLNHLVVYALSLPKLSLNLLDSASFNWAVFQWLVDLSFNLTELLLKAPHFLNTGGGTRAADHVVTQSVMLAWDNFSSYCHVLFYLIHFKTLLK